MPGKTTRKQRWTQTIEALDEQVLKKFDSGQASDHEVKIMLIAKIQEIIEYCNAIGDWRIRLANKAVTLLPDIQKLLDKNSIAYSGKGDQ